LASFAEAPKALLRLLHWPPQIAYAVGLGPQMGNLVLLLTTTGRKSGKRRVTPLQYEEMDGRLYLGAARGTKADWIRNIQADPKVEVRVKARRFSATAELATDIPRIADFLEARLRRHPRMVESMFAMEGMSRHPDRQALEKYAARLALAVIPILKE
jgi:deazaflavin-dependent oxidoreductase (nitroreductase family)